MAISVIVGRPGQGKSILLVKHVRRWCRRGWPVYTNIDIKDAKFLKKYAKTFHYIESFEEIINVRHGKIILDEVQVYLNSRNWANLDERFQLFLQQHRKKGLDIIGATQSIKRTDTVFRELVQFYFRVGKIFSFKIPYTSLAYGWFWQNEYDPDEIDTQGATRSENRLRWLPDIIFADDVDFALYDTTQIYNPQVRVGQRVTEDYVIAEKRVEVKQLIDRKIVQP